MGFDFLSPLYLAGAAFLAIPVIVHLLSKRRASESDWSDIRFLRQAVAARRRSMRLEDVRLLALRAGLILLLSLALAKPVLKAGQTAIARPGRHTHIVLIVDHSLSMDVIQNGIPRIDRAKERLREILSGHSLIDRVTLILAAGLPRVALKGIHAGSLDIQTEIDRLQPSYGGSDLGAAIRMGLSMVEPAEAMKTEFYLVTDMQRSAWESVRFDPEEAGEKDVDLFLISVAGGKVTNLAPTAMRIESENQTPSGLETVIRYRVECFGPGPKTPVRLRQIMAGKEQSSALVHPGPGRPALRTFSTLINAQKPIAGYVELERDALDPDNRFFFALGGNAARRILLVDGVGRGQADNENLFLLTCLETLGPAWGLAVQHVEAPRVFDGVRFSVYDLVILADVPDFTDGSASALRAYVKEGGRVLMFLGPHVNSGRYNELLYPDLLPGQLQARPALLTTPYSIVHRAADHPLFTLFNQERLDIGAAHFWGWWYPDPETRVESRVLAYLPERRPLLIERGSGQGMVLVCTSAAGGEWTDFPSLPLYVPWIGEMVKTLLAGRREPPPRTVGSMIPLKVAHSRTSDPSVQISVAFPDGRTEERQISLRDGTALIHFEETKLPGIYRFEPTPGDGETTVSPRIAALNTPREESDLETMSVEEARARVSAFRVASFESRGSLVANIVRLRRGRPLWDYLLILVLLFLLGETVYGNWVRRQA